MSFELKRNNHGVKGPLVFVILDGVGIYRGQKDGYPGNAFDLARTPVLDTLMQSAAVYRLLQAHGTAVGMPDDSDMGNSEVGHNAMGAGRVFDQGAKLVSNAIQSGAMFQGPTWMEFIGNTKEPGLALQNKDRTVHFLGLLSDGNVHSHIDHLISMLHICSKEGVENVRIHTLLDGRDVDEVSAHRYIDQLEEVLADINATENRDYRIASGGGRMQITMDRYEADWSMVELGWQTHVAGIAQPAAANDASSDTKKGRFFSSAKEAVETLRNEYPGTIDQDLPPFVIGENGKPIGPIQDDDIVIFFNFRGDRAIEISRAMTENGFNKFKRIPEVNVHYAGMMEYDGDLKLPEKYLVMPPSIDRTISQYLVHNNVNQFAISETQKFGHVTYFWNGNNSEKFSEELETWQEIPSDRISFDKAPAMKAREVTDATIAALESGTYGFLRINYANGDMVGHTGILSAAIESMEIVDECVGKLLNACEKHGATVIITADHGNCDQMIEIDKQGQPRHKVDGSYMAKTSHTLSPVPFILTGKDAENFKDSGIDGGLANLAATILLLLGFEKPDNYCPAVIEKK